MGFLDNMTRSPGLLSDIAHPIQEKDELKRREQMSDVIKGVKSLRDVPNRYQRDEDFVTKCVHARPEALKDIHPIFKNNASIFRAAMTDNNSTLVLMYAGDKLRADKEFVFDSIGFNRGELNIKYMDDSLKNDKAFVLRLVQYNPMTIQYVSDELRDDDDIASAAISKKGQCIKFFSQRIQSDPKMITQAVTAKEPLQEKWDWTQNNDTIEAVLRKDPLKIRELPKDLQNDYRIIQYAISNASDGWSAAPRWNRDQILSAAERDGCSPFDVTYLKNSPHTEWDAIEQKQLARAISHTPEVLFRASDNILNDTELLVDAMNRNSQVAIVFNNIYSHRPEKVTDLLSQWVKSEHFNPRDIKPLVDAGLFSMEDRAYKIVSNNPEVFEYFSDDMRDNRTIAEFAVIEQDAAFNHAVRQITEKAKQHSLSDLSFDESDLPAMSNKFEEINYDLKFPNGHQVESEIDLISSVMYMWGLDGEQAREQLAAGEFSEQDLQRAINYWVEKTDGLGFDESDLPAMSDDLTI